MRLAAHYDVHGNLPALEAVLDEALAERVDAVVVGGDVAPGPMVRECMDLFASLPVPVSFITGNGEPEMFAVEAGHASRVPERFHESVRWVAASLTVEQRAAMASWPLTLAVSVEGVGEVLFCHSTPRDHTEIFTVRTPEEKLARVFAGCPPLAVCGHTHMQFDRKVGGVRVVNSGSVGMPFCPAGGYWLLLGSGVELRRTEYDLAAAASRIRASGYPLAEEFAMKYVLDPPSSEEMLALFSQYELAP